MKLLRWVDRYFASIIGAAMIVASILPAGCVSNPVKTAMTATPENKPETVAFAIYTSYTVVAENAADIAEDSSTPREVRATILKLHNAADPVISRLKIAADRYNDVKAALSTGESTEAKVVIALGELQRLIEDAAPKLGALSSAVSDVTSTGGVR